MQRTASAKTCETAKVRGVTRAVCRVTISAPAPDPRENGQKRCFNLRLEPLKRGTVIKFDGALRGAIPDERPENSRGTPLGGATPLQSPLTGDSFAPRSRMEPWPYNFMNEIIVVCGAAGYVGRNLVKALSQKKPDATIVAISRDGVLPTEVSSAKNVSSVALDLFDPAGLDLALSGATHVYNLAAKVGGIGYVSDHKAECMSSAAININLLRALPDSVQGYFFTSSSCVYSSSCSPLAETSVDPRNLSGYGLEKYFSEQVCTAYGRDKGLPVRIGRLHTVYGPGDFRGGCRDHFPTAMARGVAYAKLIGDHSIKILGDGEQRRSLLYIDDAVEGIQRIMAGGYCEPINLGSSEYCTVNTTVSELEAAAGLTLTRFYCKTGERGVQHKTTDNSLIRRLLAWEPMTPSKAGLSALYRDAWDLEIS